MRRAAMLAGALVVLMTSVAATVKVERSIFTISLPTPLPPTRTYAKVLVGSIAMAIGSSGNVETASVALTVNVERSTSDTVPSPRLTT